MVAQNMASHYKRVLSAKCKKVTYQRCCFKIINKTLLKASIDAKPPKSMVKSQKARDRVKRDTKADNKSLITRPRSAESSRQVISMIFFLFTTSQKIFSLKREPLVDSQKLNTFRDTSATRSHNQSMYNMMQTMTVNNTKRVPVKSYTTQNTSRNDENENENNMLRSMLKGQNMSSSHGNNLNTENL
jgi:hypothetical protein